jgi:hypothetical protein
VLCRRDAVLDAATSFGGDIDDTGAPHPTAEELKAGRQAKPQMHGEIALAASRLAIEDGHRPGTEKVFDEISVTEARAHLLEMNEVKCAWGSLAIRARLLPRRPEFGFRVGRLAKVGP